MKSRRLKSFWTSTETYEALQLYIDLNEDGLKEALTEMLIGQSCKVDTGSFQNDMMTMSMTEQFFSIQYAGRGDLFEGLAIWEEEAYRNLQGTYPVISLSFANVKENRYEKVRYRICQILMNVYLQNRFLLEGDILADQEKAYFNRICETMSEEDATMSLHYLSQFLSRYYH